MLGETLPKLGQVMSGLASAAPRITDANPSIRAERLSPPTRSGRMSPVARTRDVHRIALEMLTPKRAAAWRRDSPASTTANTRLRRSTDSGFVMPAGLLTSRHLESDSRSRVNPTATLQAGKTL